MTIFTKSSLILVRKSLFTYICVLLFLSSCGDKNVTNSCMEVMQPVFGVCDTVNIDTMDVKNPYIVYDHKTDMYYMTGDKGFVWNSKNLHQWVGPYNVLEYDKTSWLGASPAIESPEIHKFANKYYYMATFETSEHRSCETLVADRITGPYKTINSKNHLLDVKEIAANPTFCSDEFGNGYMIYNSSDEQNSDATVQVIMYGKDFGYRLGEAFVMFKTSQIPWSCKLENSNRIASSLLESPFIVYSGEDGFGVLFTAYAGEEKAVGVAYSGTSTLNGPWVIEEEPLLKGFNSVSMFDDYDGTPVMVVGKDTVINGVGKSVPQLIKTDLQFEKLKIKGYYKF